MISTAVFVESSQFSIYKFEAFLIYFELRTIRVPKVAFRIFDKLKNDIQSFILRFYIHVNVCNDLKEKSHWGTLQKEAKVSSQIVLYALSVCGHSFVQYRFKSLFSTYSFWNTSFSSLRVLCFFFYLFSVFKSMPSLLLLNL